MRQTNTRAMIETGFLTAIIIVLTIIGTNVPFLGFLASVVVPATLAVIGVRWGSKYSCSAATGAFFLLSFIHGPILAMIEAVTFSLMGICIGEGYRAKWSPVKQIIVPATAFVLSVILVFGASNLFMNIDYMAIYNSINSEFEKSMMSAYAEQSLDVAQQETLAANLATSLAFVKYAFVSMVFLASTVVTFITSKLAATILRRVGIPVIDLPSLSTWHMPKWAFYLLVAGLITQYWATAQQLEWALWLAPNLIVIGALLCGVNGVACLWNIFETYGLKTIWRSIITVILFMMMAQTLVIFGVFDMFLDMRGKFVRSRNGR